LNTLSLQAAVVLLKATLLVAVEQVVTELQQVF
jgi:hypothetical protein